MPELPFPPDLDQLRRQARELRRAAAHGEPAAVARLRAVSDRVTLSAAQLAVAREYGFRSWPALKAEVELDRSIDLGAKPPLPAAVSPDLLEPPEERWSFGGVAAIETAGGDLFPELLVTGPGHASVHASLVPPTPATPPLPAAPRQRRPTQKERLAETERRRRHPLARRLTLRFRAAGEQVTVACDLPSDDQQGPPASRGGDPPAPGFARPGRRGTG